MGMIIVKGYKQGRAVMFYDITAIDGSCAKSMIPKDEIVKMCGEGLIGNAKIQWWEGKPIVRVADKNLPIVKLDDAGHECGVVEKATRNTKSGFTQPKEIKTVAITTSKPARRKKLDETIYTGYAVDNSHKLASEINYTEINTVGDLFDLMAKEFGVRNAEKYKANFGKKVNLSMDIRKNTQSIVLSIQDSMATYLMNMANLEIRDTYMKYKPSIVF